MLNLFEKLKVHTSEITTKGFSLDINLSKEDLDKLIFEPLQPYSFTSQKKEVLVKFKIDKETDDFYKAFIKADFSFEFPCLSCLETLIFDVSLDFSLRLMPALKEINQAEIIFIPDEEPIVSYFEGNIIDLSLILREQIFLSLPDYPKCPDFKPCQKQNFKALDNVVNIRENPFVKYFKKM